MTNDEIQQLILTRGIPGSRKTTYALEWVALNPEWRVRVNRDDLRFSLYGEYVLDRHREETVTTVQKSMVEAALKAKMSVVIDDTNLTDRFVKEWLRLAQKMGVRSEFVDFNVPLEQALADNKARGDAGGRFVPEDVIRSFHQRFVNRKTGLLKPHPVLDPTFEPIVRKYVRQPGKPKAVLVDIDGTVAKMEERGPFEWHRVGEDSPIQNVIDLAMRVQASGAQLIFMSGRDEVCREETYDWLVRHMSTNDFRPPVLFMRPEGNMEPDQIVKPAMFWKHVGEEYDVIAAFDDRQKVVDMYRSMGITVAQVAPGDF